MIPGSVGHVRLIGLCYCTAGFFHDHKIFLYFARKNFRDLEFFDRVTTHDHTPNYLLLKMLTISSVKAMIRGYHSKLLGKNYHAMIRGYHSKLLGKNYHAMIRGYHSKLLGKNYHAMITGYHSKLLGKNYLAQECKTDSENQFVVAVTKGKTIQVSHTCTKTLSSERLV